MSEELTTPKNPSKDEGNEEIIHLAGYIINENAEGIQIKILNKIELRFSEGLPKYVIGTTEIDGQLIPVIDKNAKKGLEPHKIEDDSCIIVQKRSDGKHTLSKAGIHKNISSVLDIISKRL